MEKEALIHFIQNNVQIGGPILQEIISYFEPVEYEVNALFVKEGNISNHYLFLEEGVMRAFTFDTEGNEVTTYFHTKNRVVFEAASFFMRTPSAESIQAISKCKGYAITFDELNKLFHALPEFREFGRKMLVKEFVAYKQKGQSMINKRAEERYSYLMETNKEIFQFVQLKHIASYLGITDTSLSRIRKEFSKKH